MKFNFSVDHTIPGQGAFDPFTNDFKFKDDGAIIRDVFTEEFFHAYQKIYYPGGTAQYVATTSNPNPPAGRANMEFEAWLMRDIMGMTGTQQSPPSSGCCHASADPQYFLWLTTITNNGAKWPQWSDMQEKYYFWMDRFKAEHPIYNFPTNYNLKPDAYLSILANSTCPK
ncbi:hypothetical protein LZD49_33360 [Dyadobacter sp. CY261]|uniref:hypothetical protein n=1 Tax=Dyadobacter sp. CY261 TaxID=2907203 RepID=UPI001F2A7E82|nr:hypothetical protein [Dyadobacter sp. CY261]MCF0075415.1 hypothetical protein [Dyadobacter sp. CY261]